MAINVYRISANPALYEPSRDNAFRFLVGTELNRLLPAALASENATEEDYLTGGQELIELATNSASVPHFTLDEVSIKRGNTTAYYASTPSYGEQTIKCDDFVGARVKDVLLAWQALAFDVRTGVVNTAENYKIDCKLIEYSSDFSKVIRSWTLKGCWVKGLSEDDFSHDSNNRRSISVSIRYDYAIPEINREIE